MSKNEIKSISIDYSQLMDLRVDYAFKIFAQENPDSLVSLLNAIFANAKIDRIVKFAVIKNPNIDKKSVNDKYSILDVRAELDDGTNILIEMHLHGKDQIKAKVIRSWARAYGEELLAGHVYTSQLPTVSIAFVDGAVNPIEKPKKVDETKKDKNKIHRVCMIMDKDDAVVFSEALELHFIDMKAFAKAVNDEEEGIKIKETSDDMFVYWLSVITEKEIANKDFIDKASKEKEAIRVALSAIARQSEDKIIRQAYQRRKDEIFFHNMSLEESRQKAEQERIRAEQAEDKIEQERCRAEQAEAQIAEQAKIIAELQAQLANKEVSENPVKDG